MNNIIDRLTRRPGEPILEEARLDSSTDTAPNLVDIGDVRTFTQTEVGSGAFGRWQVDSYGLPGYEYDLDQHADLRARFPNSQGLDRRDHWYPIGNDRVIGLAYNEGYVQLYLGDRGGTLINRFDDGTSPEDWIEALTWLPEPLRNMLKWFDLRLRLYQQNLLLARWRANHPTHTNLTTLAGEIQGHMATEMQTAPRHPTSGQHYAGGFGFVDDGQEVWSTAYRYRPKGAETRRFFGMGYFETEMTHRDILVTRRVYAPYGDDPLLLADVTIRNLSDIPRTLHHYEYWDVNVYQLKTNLFQTGLPALASIDARMEINDSFLQSLIWQPDQQMLRSHLSALPNTIPADTDPSSVDWYPSDIFLIDLQGQASAVYTDTAAFFGDGNATCPAAVVNHLDTTLRGETSASQQPFCMVQRRDLTLAAGQSMTLRYAYGTVRPDEQPDFAYKHRLDTLDDTLDNWKDHLAYFSTGDTPVLHREMAWHAYALQQASVYNAYFKTHVITQGSAYLFLHGLDGAPRDQVLFATPLIYIRPDLARETLILIMAITNAESRAMSYGFSGYGVLDSALVHSKPSDLDLFLLMGLSEYLAATGDVGFLDREVPYYPASAKPPGGVTVLEHARTAFDHLINDVGRGDNGLIRVGDGDWSDGIVLENASARLFLGVSFENSVAYGESIPNTQMALYVLPLAASVFESRDPAFAQKMRAVVPAFKEAVEQQWAGRWYNRALLRDILNRGVTIGKYAINLEAQPWALISGAAAEAGHEAALIQSIDTLLDAPSPTGAPYMENGRIASAISQLLTWGYVKARPDLAWRSLNKQLFATHATVFPNIWFGIWTAPDIINGTTGDYPGGTWMSPVTPMTDFPAMNSNPHAMALLALIRLCGLEPAADGLKIAPGVPKTRFILDLPLIRLEVDQTSIRGEYRAANDGTRALYVTLPTGASLDTAQIGDQTILPTDPAYNATQPIRLPFTFRKGDRVAFSVSWVRPTPAAAPVLQPIMEVRL